MTVTLAQYNEVKDDFGKILRAMHDAVLDLDCFLHLAQQYEGGIRYSTIELLAKLLTDVNSVYDSIDAVYEDHFDVNLVLWTDVPIY